MKNLVGLSQHVPDNDISFCDTGMRSTLYRDPTCLFYAYFAGPYNSSQYRLSAQNKKRTILLHKEKMGDHNLNKIVYFLQQSLMMVATATLNVNDPNQTL